MSLLPRFPLFQPDMAVAISNLISMGLIGGEQEEKRTKQYVGQYVLLANYFSMLEIKFEIIDD